MRSTAIRFAEIALLGQSHHYIRQWLSFNGIPAPCPMCKMKGFVEIYHNDMEDMRKCTTCKGKGTVSEYGR